MKRKILAYKKACGLFVKACGGIYAPQKTMMNLPLYSCLGFSAPNGLSASISLNRKDAETRRGFSYGANKLAQLLEPTLFNQIIGPYNIY